MQFELIELFLTLGSILALCFTSINFLINQKLEKIEVKLKNLETDFTNLETNLDKIISIVGKVETIEKIVTSNYYKYRN